MPTGSCTGANADRARISAKTSNMAPASALAGTRIRCSLPTINRTKCGTTSPTKPMPPARETAPAVSKEDKINMNNRN